jgi:hypothetical protein
VSDRRSVTDELATLLNTSVDSLRYSTSSGLPVPPEFFGQPGANGRVPTGAQWTGESEDLRRRTAVEAARKAIAKPTRGAVLETTLRGIAVRASGRDDPAVRLAAIEALVGEALRAFSRDDRTPDDPEDARESLDWRRACDDAYTDGITARKCGLGPVDHGLALDTERSRALAQAFMLGWSVADEAAAFEDVAEAARLVLRFGDAPSRDALRAAIAALPKPEPMKERT